MKNIRTKWMMVLEKRQIRVVLLLFIRKNHRLKICAPLNAARNCKALREPRFFKGWFLLLSIKNIHRLKICPPLNAACNIKALRGPRFFKGWFYFIKKTRKHRLKICAPLRVPTSVNIKSPTLIFIIYCRLYFM